MNLTQKFESIVDGQFLTSEDGKTGVTLKEILLLALNYNDPKADTDTKYKRGELAKLIKRGNRTDFLFRELDVTMLKICIPLIFSPLVVNQSFDMLDNKITNQGIGDDKDSN